MSRWEIQVKLNLSLWESSTIAANPPGPLFASLSPSNHIDAAKRVTDVKLKFQLRDAVFPSKSVFFAEVGSLPALTATLTGRGSCHVTLAPSEIEDYSHLHWVLLEWQDVCWQGSEFHCKQSALSLSHVKSSLSITCYLLTQELLNTISPLRSVQNAQPFLFKVIEIFQQHSQGKSSDER